ncbi:TetR/AcrR family transcriptional regulator [Endozoicomonas sp. OPT23]|uniref:TetR/AcrR family transcriptional regulator n=1 Tax=Endozoicomonas sp. OPT23 TaxID=2072845 RepID=UPI00129B0F16|nr:TetR/AcrR family transcriptional regulator [Endozoicomonas sp. OPT23]MRI31476.1 TetR/AcrR family transcriptional regulator [Endozoicomonas sp. OPT23]
MAPSKKVGRPRNFDIDTALQCAIHVFWEKGYDGASMKDLTQAMGINSPSLYSVFGDKKGLYIQAIQRYMNNESCGPMDAFESEESIEKAICAFMKATLDYATETPEHLGCFMTNCVSTSAGTVEGVQELLQEAILAADLRLAARFDSEKNAGNLPENFPSLERARLMFDLRQGYVLRARAGTSREAMLSDLSFRVQMILNTVII